MHVHTRRAKRISKRARKTDYPPRVAKHLPEARSPDKKILARQVRRRVAAFLAKNANDTTGVDAVSTGRGGVGGS